MHFNFLTCITLVIESAYLSETTGIVQVEKEKRFVKEKLFFLYIGFGKNLLKYLKISLKNPAFEDLFLSCS